MTSADFLLVPVGNSTYILVHEGTREIVDEHECLGAEAARRHWAARIADNPNLKIYIRCGGQ